MRREIEKELAKKVNSYKVYLKKKYNGLIPEKDYDLIFAFYKYALNNPIDSMNDIPEKFNEILNA
jgi:hypothetical protein